jgi:eukaryotic-like serine/threonine-protein kinase
MKKHTLLIITVLALTILMSACVGGSRTGVASGWASLTTDEDTAYVAFNSFVHAINLANGSERWHYPAEADAKITFYAEPTLTEDGQLIVGGYDNVLYSLNPENGQLNWSFDGADGRFVGGALAAGGLILAPSADHMLYALNLNGTLAWAQPFETEEPLWAAPATDENCDCIYLGSMDHKVYAIDTQSGRLLWKTDDLGGSVVSTPIISADHQLYVGTFANEMVALDAETGRAQWQFATENWIWGSPAIDEDTLYFGDLDGKFYALDRTTGQSQWQIQPGSAIVGTPLVTAEGIFFTTEEGSLVAVNPEGVIRWNQPFEDNMHAGPVTTGESILVTTSNPENLLIAVDTNGVQKWSFGLEK